MEDSMLLHVEWWNTNQIFSWRVVILRPRKRDIGEKANRSRSSRGRDGGRLSPESGGPLEEEQRCAFLRLTGAGGRQCPRKTWHSTRPDSPNNWAAGMPSRRAYFLRCVHKSHPQSSSEHIWTDHDGLSQCGSQLWLHVSFWNSWNPLPLVFDLQEKNVSKIFCNQVSKIWFTLDEEIIAYFNTFFFVVYHIFQNFCGEQIFLM